MRRDTLRHIYVLVHMHTTATATFFDDSRPAQLAAAPRRRLHHTRPAEKITIAAQRTHGRRATVRERFENKRKHLLPTS